MIFSEYIPTELLRPFVKAYRIIESNSELINRVVPNTSLAIAFRFKGKIGYIVNGEQNNLPIATFSGLRKSVRFIKYCGNSSAIIVQFNETGASAFFKQPMHELFEESVSLDNFIVSQKITEIEDQLSEAANHYERIEVVEQFLLSILVNPKPDRLISMAMAKIRSSNGDIRIKELAASLNISHDAFEKRFRRTIGATPKQFASIVRLNSIIYAGPKDRSNLDMAIDSGYYDQPHFNKDFKFFTGQTPTDFFKSGPFW
jgi:AraC-like DNA-binding protein